VNNLALHKKITWNNEKRNISDLNPAVYNPRKLTKKQAEQLTKSLDKFSLADPIVINKNNTIIGGHQRINILKAKNIIEVDVRVPDRRLTDEEEKELNLRLNKNLGEWDFDLLKGFDENLLTDIGFDTKELDKIFQSEANPEDDSVPEERPTTDIKLGDMFQLGEHRLLCGDATKKEDVKKLMQGEKADMVFTDPPYEMDTVGGGVLKHANSMAQIKENGVDSFDPSALELYARINIFFCNHPLIKKYIELSELNGQSWDLAIYKKEHTAPNYGNHLKTDIEYIMMIGEQNPNKGLDSELYSKCFVGNKDKENKLSYSKPVAICEKFIYLYSTREGICLDFFGGSGSTLIACEKLNRKCRMMEIDPVYCQVIIDRWEKFTGQKVVKINE
jgi:DNA modification methylase